MYVADDRVARDGADIQFAGDIGGYCGAVHLTAIIRVHSPYFRHVAISHAHT